MAEAVPDAVPGAEIAANNLLRALHRDDARCLAPHLKPMLGEAGAVLHHPGDVVQQVYFPCGASLVSYKVALDDGRMIETALIGREGAVGGIVSKGRLPAYARAEVQHTGPLLRIALSDLDQVKSQAPQLAQLFTRYADCLVAQIFQQVACNAGHSIEQRTAKWLLAAMSRTDSTIMPVTQEQLSLMLGVGRSYLSRVIGSLKAEGLLATRRGSLVVCDVERLKTLSCTCDQAVRAHFDTLLAGVYPKAPDGEG